MRSASAVPPFDDGDGRKEGVMGPSWGTRHHDSPQVLYDPLGRLSASELGVGAVLPLEATQLFLEPLPLVGTSTIATLPPENVGELGVC